MSLIKQWKRLIREDPDAKIRRELDRNQVSIDNIEDDIEYIDIYYFPTHGDPRSGASTWTLNDTYWGSSDVAGDIETILFALPNIHIVGARLYSLTMIYHVEVNLTVGPQVGFYGRALIDSDTALGGTQFGSNSAAGATANTVGAAPHEITTTPDENVVGLTAPQLLLAARISACQQVNLNDLRILGFKIRYTRTKPKRVPV